MDGIYVGVLPVPGTAGFVCNGPLVRVSTSSELCIENWGKASLSLNVVVKLQLEMNFTF